MNANQSPSQAALILHELNERRGEWVPMPDLCAVSGAYAVHSRCAELRTKLGLNIENKTVTAPGSRTKLSFYRLL